MTTTTTSSDNSNSSSHPGPQKSTVPTHLSNTKDSWHGIITSDGDGQFTPDEGRYHLYIGLFCPFAHRINLIRHLITPLLTTIPISIVLPYPKGDDKGWPGWKFPSTETEYPGATPDHLYGSEYLHELYFKCDAGYKGRYSVPVLWDKRSEGIVCNESAELMRWLPGAFGNRDRGGGGGGRDMAFDFYPEELRDEIDRIGEWMQRDLNTGVYKAGFAETQEEYDENVLPVFAALNKIEKIIAANHGPFVLGRKLTELDLRLYPTIIRFDTVYVQHFKCNLGMSRSNYPQIHNWMKGLYWGKSVLQNGRNVWGFGEETTDFKHIKENYTKSHGDINPKGITPRGPWPDVEEGYEEDYSKVLVNGIEMEEVVELEKKLM